MLIQRPQILAVFLPYFDKMSQIVKTSLTRAMNQHMKFCKLSYFQTNNRLRNFFRFKDFVPETLRSSLVYKFLCGSSTSSYIGNL